LATDIRLGEEYALMFILPRRSATSPKCSGDNLMLASVAQSTAAKSSNSGKIIKEAMAAPNIWEMECEGVLEGRGSGGHFLRAVRAEKQIYLVSTDDSTSVRTAGGWEDEWPRVSSRLIECVRSFAIAKQQTK
jgi:hypothetical protein